jgi:hypothetical protein
MRLYVVKQRSKPMTLVEAPIVDDRLAPVELLDPHPHDTQMHVGDHAHFAKLDSFWQRNAPVNYERIAAEAAELADQLWLEIEAEFTRAIARCQAAQCPQARMSGAPGLRDDQPWPSWPARPADCLG